MNRPNKYTQQDFLNKAKQVHGDRYDYSLVEYKSMHQKIRIICPECCEFLQSPAKHLFGQKCPIHYGTKKRTKEEFVIQSKQVHGEKYIYDHVVYKNNKTKVKIECRIHGTFFCIPVELKKNFY